MPRRIFEFDPADRFVAGTVGQPGARTFFLQAKKGSAVVSVALEKAQVAALAERMGALILALQQQGVDLPEPSEDSDVSPLDEPINEQFRVGTLSLAWDGERDAIVVEAREMTGEDDDEVPDEAEEGPDVVRVTMTPAEARDFARRAMQVLAAGRPPCPICGQPLDPGGHLCPRRNGYIH